MNRMPPESVLKWVAKTLGSGAKVVTTKGLHEGSGPWLLHVSEGSSTRDVVLRVADMGRIWPQAIATGATALQVAETNGLPSPRLIASDLDGQATSAAVTLETALQGSSASPPTVSAERLREAGAALAKVHAVSLTPQHHLPLHFGEPMLITMPYGDDGRPYTKPPLTTESLLLSMPFAS